MAQHTETNTHSTETGGPHPNVDVGAGRGIRIGKHKRGAVMRNKELTCEIEGCAEPAYAVGLCKPCYNAIRRNTKRGPRGLMKYSKKVTRITHRMGFIFDKLGSNLSFVQRAIGTVSEWARGGPDRRG